MLAIIVRSRLVQQRRCYKVGAAVSIRMHFACRERQRRHLCGAPLRSGEHDSLSRPPHSYHTTTIADIGNTSPTTHSPPSSLHYRVDPSPQYLLLFLFNSAMFVLDAIMKLTECAQNRGGVSGQRLRMSRKTFYNGTLLAITDRHIKRCKTKFVCIGT